MSDIITLTGIVATIPRALTTGEGLAITSFRLASTQRKFDRASERWVDGETNWYTITTFRQLATNSAVSVKKGERVVVTGRLRIRDWQNGDKTGTNIEVDAEALGHDLAWGTAAFSRSVGSAPVDAIAAEFPSDADAPSEQSESDASQLVGVAAGSATDIETPF
ncbi:MAG: single-stranded DNA-binding protein [Glaciihabitans sp.]|jgi:single-strand DNA-binding protein|nr:single-stranded DNA-binding protein [Glaciihabitans sp.]MDQ1569487.1 single-strand DNA-binding protein [Actinomycetota bacterium]